MPSKKSKVKTEVEAGVKKVEEDVKKAGLGVEKEAKKLKKKL